MTAGRMPGTIGLAVCTGCQVGGFGAHACTGDAVELSPTGQARIERCACQVDAGCQNYKALPRYPVSAL